MTKTNVELLKRLRTRFLRMRHRKHFNMNVLAHKTECGTAMCIAGHALSLAGFKPRWNSFNEFEWFSPSGRIVESPLDAAQKLLGLSKEEAQGTKGLFYRYDLKTPKQAARVIDKIIQEASA